MSTNTMINWKPENVVRQLPWRLDSKTALGFLLILATFSLVGWLFLTQASAVTATRYHMDELRVELEQLENQNTALALEIAQLENLSRVEERAHELGLGPTTNVRYLAVDNYPFTQVDVVAQDFSGRYEVIDVEPPVSDAPSPLADWWVDTMDDVTAWLAKE
jgi:cell division protein FtsL